MLNFEFELNADEIGKQIHGLSMGHITVKGKFGSATSKNRVPDQAMMLFISIRDLLYAIISLNSRKGGFHIIFEGIDSSFSIKFYKKKNHIEVIINTIKIDEVMQNELIKAISNSLNKFLSTYSSNFDRGRGDTGDRVFADLYDALEEFKELLEGNLN